ncbi:MBL fold metallo-hydrolase [Sphingobium boeckii]|uniref:L-ascorbate metabolism protein UlaG (Beta-lactamase superfamily) n=1 Tax=Sphingobium boeckii TaxID=1082345 RepID=A0A7W9AIS8_9SPHN|nr:MBL fold metallo-hydrolase [Sphingobium boeckii]MBB5686259.1 L-ascorbate metabolism protein UlaG (beta-lactamase superfamily) [Sphingobium boeckii]
MRGAITKAMKWAVGALLLLVVATCLTILIVPPFLDRIYYEGPHSAHYDGAHFFNPDGEDTARLPGGGSRGGFIGRWILGNEDRPPWPAAVPVTPSKPAARVEGDRMVATWVGHATVLVQTQGLNILTDPIWSDVAGPFNLAGPRRVAVPGIRLEDLPKIDLVLVSHNHYDHMDLPTLGKLWDRDRPKIVTSLGNDSIIRDSGAEAIALDWGGRITLRPGVDVIVTRNHHWGSRWGTDRNRALWSSFTVTLPGGNLFFAGDTGAGDMQWPVEAAWLGPVRLAILPIGAFRFQPGQMRTGSHIGPRESVQVFERLGASFGLPIHWGTFRLSSEAYDTPPKMLDIFTRCVGVTPGVFAAQRIGVPLSVPAYEAPGQRAAVDDPACRDGSPALQALK